MGNYPKNPDAKAEKEIERKISESERKTRSLDSVRDKYRSFLRNGRSKAAVIFPDLNCELLKPGKLITVEESQRCADALQLQKNGSLYSFVIAGNYTDYFDERYDKRLNIKGWWDLHFSGGNFIVGNCCVQGMIADLGNIAIESLTVNSPSIAYLKNFKAKTTVDDIQQQNQSLHDGIDSGGVTYQKVIPAITGHVYALRSIAYRDEIEKKSSEKRIKVISDRITVFKVVENGENGSLILLWKKTFAFR